MANSLKKPFLLALAIIFLVAIPQISATPDLEIKKTDKGSIIIAELNQPAKFDFLITNKGEKDNFEIYSLVGVSMSPKGTFELHRGRKKIEVLAFPNEQIRKKHRGLFAFEYEIRGQDSGIFKDNLVIKITSLEEILSFSAKPISPEKTTIEFTIQNLEKVKIENLDIVLTSPFFDFKDTVSIEELGETTLTIPLDPEELDKAVAGPYKINVLLGLKDSQIEKTIDSKYLEREGLSVESYSKGFFITSNTIRKVNEGNIPTRARVEMQKNLVSRLFTTFSEPPDSSSRDSFIISYIWIRDLGPKESITVIASTNYIFPFVLIALLIIIFLFLRIYLLTDLSLKKRVAFIKTKGGEFALKVVLRIKARKTVDNIRLVDFLPGMVKLYEKYGRPPDKVDEEKRKLSWSIPKLNAGEERVFSYVIYSKIKTVGRFELPAARAVYEINNEKKNIGSNKTFFMSEPSFGD